MGTSFDSMYEPVNMACTTPKRFIRSGTSGSADAWVDRGRLARSQTSFASSAGNSLASSAVGGRRNRSTQYLKKFAVGRTSLIRLSPLLLYQFVSKNLSNPGAYSWLYICFISCSSPSGIGADSVSGGGNSGCTFSRLNRSSIATTFTVAQVSDSSHVRLLTFMYLVVEAVG